MPFPERARVGHLGVVRAETDLQRQEPQIVGGRSRSKYVGYAEPQPGRTNQPATKERKVGQMCANV